MVAIEEFVQFLTDWFTRRRGVRLCQIFHQCVEQNRKHERKSDMNNKREESEEIIVAFSLEIQLTAYIRQQKMFCGSAGRSFTANRDSYSTPLPLPFD
ncbi:hypothetical protein KIN20_031072 [Parelaphostrongylus tenuis]|uniref:Uncharacterized protein n=1 Tax=Parelaphostrongylus tenuis TaxID=148309 RepID=A0AAD5R4L9_PARTN|nr:hypothetical protein KIN20_031072 [Parelaphostrongylus tenuis]